MKGTDRDALRTRSTTEGTDRCTTPPPIPKCLVHGLPSSKRAWPLQYLLSILKPYTYFNFFIRVSGFQVVSFTFVTVEISRSLRTDCSHLALLHIRMFSVSSPLVAALTCLTTLVSLVSSHTVLTYPSWRGDNLKKSGDILQEHGLGVGANQTFPYGMQWIYPCTQESPLKVWLNSSNSSLKAEVCPFRPIALSGQ